MKSKKPGKSTSTVEILNISKNGIWLLVQDQEFFLDFKAHSWFKNANIAEIYNVKLLHGRHLYWKDLEVDLELESLVHPEKYPLTYKKVA